MFPAPVNFVVFDLEVFEGKSADTPLDNYLLAHPQAMQQMSSRGDLCWCALTYFRLKEHGIADIRLSTQIDPGCINVVHSLQLRGMAATPQAFVVCVRADFDRRLWAHYHLVQNSLQLRADTSCIYLWPQPGLIGRASLPDAIRAVGYLGQTFNGNLAWRPDRIAAEVQQLGIEFRAPEAGWHDLGGFDALIAIRSFDKRPYATKPPSKLVNAWLAGVPFIGGSDSAYEQIGHAGSDYLVATTPGELVATLKRLRDDPELREALVRNGRAAASAYDNEAIVHRWIDELQGPIAVRYQHWLANRPGEARRVRSLALADRALAGLRIVKSTIQNRILNAKFG